ncbi:MAG TPA: TIGR03435 family protein [Bryobacteraceae bacterium]|nr:TIGR03435 family protein [Bryobacteraceae bacterium]
MRATVMGILFCHAAFGQAAGKLEFEAATVKPTAPLGNGAIVIGGKGGPGSADPGRINYNGLPLKMLLATAYGVKPYQISGPAWLDSERFDVVATLPEGTTKEQSSVMLQNLLLDRFAIQLHHETKDLPLYELTVAKNGPRLKASVADPNAPPDGAPPELPKGPPPIGKDGLPQLPPGRKGQMMMISPKGFHLMASQAAISALADNLANLLSSPVVDGTGLTGTYDYTLDFSRDSVPGPAGLPPIPAGNSVGAIVPGPGAAAADQPDAPSLFVALQEQLGLKLEKKKGPLDLIVVDHAEKVPAEN